MTGQWRGSPKRSRPNEAGDINNPDCQLSLACVIATHKTPLSDGPVLGQRLRRWSNTGSSLSGRTWVDGPSFGGDMATIALN